MSNLKYTDEDLARWRERGTEMGATHLLVVCDTFSYEDYPVYVQPWEKLEEVRARYAEVNMQRVHEVIDLSRPRGDLLLELLRLRPDGTLRPGNG